MRRSPWCPVGSTRQSACHSTRFGNLYVADDVNNTRLRTAGFDRNPLYGKSVTANTLSTLISSGLNTPEDVVFDAANDLYVSDYGSGSILALTSSSKTLYGTALSADQLGVVGSGIGGPSQMTVNGGQSYFSTEPAI